MFGHILFLVDKVVPQSIHNCKPDELPQVKEATVSQFDKSAKKQLDKDASWLVYFAILVCLSLCQFRCQKNQLYLIIPFFERYGSLGRNWTKKKTWAADRGGKIMKLSGSMAGLDLHEKEELRPDEHYEIGLPVVPAIPALYCTANPVFLPNRTQTKQFENVKGPKLPPKFSSTGRLLKSGELGVQENKGQTFEIMARSASSSKNVVRNLFAEQTERKSQYPPPLGQPVRSSWQEGENHIQDASFGMSTTP